MRTLTIAQRREAQLERFNADFIGDMDKARKIINTYYRYVALSYRVFEMDNSTRWYNTPYHKQESAKEARAYKRITAMLKPYDLKIFVPWIYPTIAREDKATGAIITTAIEPILYK